MNTPDRAGLVIAAGLAALALTILLQMRAMPVAAVYARVGPTTFPYVIAAALGLLSLATAASALRGGFPPRDRDRVAPILWIVGGLAAQMLLIQPLGFSIATGALFALVARGFGRGPLWLTFPIGTAFAFAVWLVFALGLQLSLPAGPLERLVS
jgi:putative tricarboxylic transport membrane protein